MDFRDNTYFLEKRVGKGNGMFSGTLSKISIQRDFLSLYGYLYLKPGLGPALDPDYRAGR